MGGPTIAQQTVAVLGFIAMLTLLGPLVKAISPASFYNVYYTNSTAGTVGIVNNTQAQYYTNYQIPILTTANSTTGFQAAGNLLTQAFSPLAFIYGGVGLFWKSLTQLPSLLYIIFYGLGSNSALFFLPVGIGAVISIIVLNYIVISDFYKLFSMWMKSDAENIGQ